MGDATTKMDLSGDQIDQLLKEAEVRLQAKSQGQDNKAVAIPSKPNNPSTPELSERNGSYSKAINRSVEANPQSSELKLRVPQPKPMRPSKQSASKTDAGPSWFNLPKTDLTPELKKDLQLLRMRDVLDTKRFYRKDSSRSLVPEFSQVGTIVEGPTDFFNGRLTKKERKRTLLEEVLQTEDVTRKFKSKYGQIQEANASGKKGHYKKMMQKRYGNKR
ncbi:Fcf2-domain-containing protein [Rostrohypoxylon terebratum]|nr:Fcf2-domain-containing protein [Rostrohypoxylon terebratum]